MLASAASGVQLSPTAGQVSTLPLLSTRQSSPLGTAKAKQESSPKSHSSRERNRIHAQKTRQRKKEQVLVLQSRADDLKKEQIRLKQTINEKNTATILVRLFACEAPLAPNERGDDATEDPLVEELLMRPVTSIPDPAKIPELPSLILPGQHSSRKMKAHARLDTSSTGPPSIPTKDDIDYELLGRDRSRCTPQELDRIRRERNRMHAKRTRDRKRVFVARLEEICRQLEDENMRLHQHLKHIDSDCADRALLTPKPVSTVTSPKIQPTPTVSSVTSTSMTAESMTTIHLNGPSTNISTLLRAAERTANLNEVSDAAGSDEDDSAFPPFKRQKRTAHSFFVA